MVKNVSNKRLKLLNKTSLTSLFLLTTLLILYSFFHTHISILINQNNPSKIAYVVYIFISIFLLVVHLISRITIQKMTYKKIKLSDILVYTSLFLILILSFIYSYIHNFTNLISDIMNSNYNNILTMIKSLVFILLIIYFINYFNYDKFTNFKFLKDKANH